MDKKKKKNEFNKIVLKYKKNLMTFYYIVNGGPKSKLFPAAKMQKSLRGLDMSPFLLLVQQLHEPFQIS